MRLAAVVVAVAACGKHAAEPERARGTTEIVVEVASPGQGTRELEASVALPLEEVVAAVPGVAHLRTRVEPGAVAIALELAPDADPLAVDQAAAGRVRDALATLPPGALPVIRINGRAGAVLRYTLRTNASRRDASQWQDDVATRMLERLPGVGRIEACGTSRPRWTVAADLPRLAAYGKTVSDLVQALRGRVFDPVKPLPDQLGDAPLVRDSAQVSLDDVRGPCTASDGAGDVIAVSIFPQAGADMLAVRETLEAKLAELARTLPRGWNLHVLPRTRPVALDVVAPHGVRDILDTLRVLARLQESVVELEHGVADLRLVPATEHDAEELERAAIRLLDAHGLEVRARSQRVVQIRGTDLDAMRAFAAEVAKRLDHPPLHVAGRIGLDEVPRMDLVVDRARVAELGIAMPTLADALRIASTDGLELATTAPIGIAITVPAPTDLTDRLRALEVATATGARVPLADLVRQVPSRDPSTILRVDRMRWVGVRIAATPEQIHDALDKLATPQGIDWRIVEPD